MSLLYIECNAGAAGDMLGAALLELLPEEGAEEALRLMNELGLPGVHVDRQRAETCGIVGTRLRVTVDGAEELEHAEGHEHHHAHRSLGGIETLIGGFTTLPEAVRQNAVAVYRSIADAEAAVHGTAPEHIHFHEVGTLDAVVDVTLACLALHLLAPDQVVVSPVRTGFGQVECAHGLLPVPAPATARLLEGIPTFAGDIEGEFCTPTGAALIRHFASAFGPQPPMVIARAGYGVGAKRFPIANCVRAFWGETACFGFEENGRVREKLVPDFDTERASKEGEGVVSSCGGVSACSDFEGDVLELCCNIDDMTGEDVAFACEQLLAAGALDVWTTAIGMKKGRPGVVISALCAADKTETIEAAFFRHTSTLGVRRRAWQRTTLVREVLTVKTPLGSVRQKVARTPDGVIVRAKWEHDDLARLARDHGMSLQDVRGALD